MPFYLIHQPVLLILAYFIVQWPVNLYGKFVILIISAFILSLAAVAFLITPVPPLAFVFGLKRVNTPWHLKQEIRNNFRTK